MATTDKLNVQLTADSSSFNSAITAAERNARQFGDTAHASANKASSAFLNLKSTIIGLGLGQALKTSLTDAMNAAESESLFAVSLGGYADKAREWSTQLSDALGLDPYALRKNVGTLYNMTTSMGLTKDASYELSTGLAQLGEDMASFYNLSSEEAFTKLRSGLTGEAEPLKALGILVDEQTIKQVAYRTGIAKTGEELTQQEKVLARYRAILEQTGNAQGDLARTMDSPANQLRRTLNEIHIASVEFGSSLMPLVQTGLPIFRQIVADISPVAKTAATGISTISTALNLLENPAARGIAYTGLAVAAISKLNASLGSTATGLMLIGSILTYIIGKYSTAEQEADAVVSTALDGATASSDDAKKSADDLNASYSELGKTIKGVVAPFDTITKLSGGSSSGVFASQFAGVEETAISATEAVANYEDALASITGSDYNATVGIDWSAVDWQALKNDLDELENDITKVFTGDEKERYEGLVSLTDKIEELFGTEWTTFWQDVGSDIFGAFNDFGSEESYDALYNLNERIKSIPFMQTFQDIGKSFGEGLADITAGIEKFLSGDFSGAEELFNAAMNKGNEVIADVVDKSPLGKFTGFAGQAFKWASQTATDFANADLDLYTIASNEGQKAVRIAQEEEAGHYVTLSEMEAAIKTYLSQGKSAEMALSLAKQDFYDPTSMLGGDFVEWYQKLPENEKLDGKVQGWAAELQKTVDVSNINTPATASDIYSIMQNMPGAGFTGPIQIHNFVELDGDKIGESVTTYQDGQTNTTNGRQ